MRAFNFIDFCLCEGAALSANGSLAELAWKDTYEPGELLQSNIQMKTSNFSTKDLPYNVLYGLSVDPDRVKELSGSPELKLLLDNLKDSHISGGKQALAEFLQPSVTQLRQSNSRIDYVMPMGSTKGLSKDLSEVFSELINGSKVLNLDKHIFDNIVKAIDWDYIEDYETNKAGQPQKRDPNKLILSILPQLIRLVITNVDLPNSAPNIRRILGAAGDWKELKGILLSSDPINRYYKEEHSITWKDKSAPFIIRSSNLSVMGDRKFLKTKYQTPKEGGIHGDPSFIEAIRRCIFSNKSMLVVDDNTRTKEDIKGILKSIDRVAQNLIADSNFDFSQGNRSVLNYRSRINVYVLIYIPPTIRMASAIEVEDYKRQLNKDN
jgi:hypothetical protein